MFLYFTVVVVLVICFFVTRKKDPRLPPGIYGWPIIGSIPSFKVSLPTQVEEYRKKFGDIFLWRVGSQTNVYLCDPKIIRKAFNNRDLIDRPEKLFTIDSLTYFTKIGLINSNGEHWQAHRRFVLRHLKESGFGKSTVEGIIHLEAEILIKNFRNHFSNTVAELPLSVTAATINVIWKLAADIRFEEVDEDLQRLIKAVTEHLTIMQGPVILLDLFPWMVPFTPKFVMNKLGATRLDEIRQCIKDYVKDVVDKRKASLNRDSPSGLIDFYLMEMENKKNTGDDFHERALIISLCELIIAGGDDVSTTLRWGLQIMACHPEVQKRIQQEIDSIVSRDRLPSISDKPKLPLTEAAVCEILRTTTLTPLGFFHAARQDTTVEQYFIPKGTIVLPFIHRCHKDPKFWEKPNKFYLEHFLDSDGNFTAKNEAFMPFSTGRRACLGENLARIELFLFMSSLLQKFSFRTAEEEAYSAEKDPRSVIFNMPPKMKLVVQER